MPPTPPDEHVDALPGIARGIEDMHAGRSQPADEVFAAIRAEFHLPTDHELTSVGSPAVVPRRFRFTIGLIMIVIAVIAVALAVVPANRLVQASLWLLIVGAPMVVGVQVLGIRWVHVAAWVFTVYPFGCMAALYATWGAAWVALGHRPRPSLDDPQSIGLLVDVPLYLCFDLLVFGALVALPMCIIGVLAEIVRLEYGKGSRHGVVVALVSTATTGWLLLGLLPSWDPVGVIFWFMD